MKATVDATTLIALGTIGELELLAELDGPLVVHPAVRREVTTEPASTNLERFLDAPGVRAETPPDDRLPEARTLLGEQTENGDVQILATVLARTATDSPIGVVSDDRRVRTTARGLGATVTGTVGVVVRAVETGLSTESALDVLDRVDSHGLHLTGSLRKRAEALIGGAGSED